MPKINKLLLINVKAFKQLKEKSEGNPSPPKKSHFKVKFYLETVLQPQGKQNSIEFGPVIHLINHNCLCFLSPVFLAKAVGSKSVLCKWTDLIHLLLLPTYRHNPQPSNWLWWKVLSSGKPSGRELAGADKPLKWTTCFFHTFSCGMEAKYKWNSLCNPLDWLSSLWFYSWKNCSFCACPCSHIL